MVTVGMNYDVLPGKEQQFERVFVEVRGVMERLGGHKQSFLFRNVHAPQSYLIISEWADANAFKAFIASEQFRNVANWGKENILARRPTHEIYGMEAPAPPGGGGCPVQHG